MNDIISVLLVDDSMVIRAALKRLLEPDPEIKVITTVTDGKSGVVAAAEHQPDVVILDIEMPIMDGLTALPQILEKSPSSKVIMFSSLTEKGADVTMRALSLGAIECLVKPTSNQDVGPGSDFETEIRTLVKTLGKEAKSGKATSAETVVAKPAEAAYTLHDNAMAYKGVPSLLAIGSSTGGPNALFEVCAHFKDFQIPIVITQHMPATFTKILAKHIEEKTGVPAHEGEDGMVLEKGHIYVAPGGFHMLFEKGEGDRVTIKLDDGEPVNFCKPSVDPMVESAVAIYGSRVLGIILTGMGSDGIGGGRAIVSNNGRIAAQDEESCVVWGMPRAVTLEGLCTVVLPLNDIGPWIRQQVL